MGADATGKDMDFIAEIGIRTDTEDRPEIGDNETRGGDLKAHSLP